MVSQNHSEKRENSRIREVLRANEEKVEDKLHVVTFVSNAAQFDRRYVLAKDFMNRMEEKEKDVILYVVELAYGIQKFAMTSPENPRHLQLRTQFPLWHKENLINVGIRRLLPDTWKAVAWIDADIEFDSEHWANDTLRLLNGAFDVLQVFSHIIDMNQEEEAMSISPSLGYQWSHNNPIPTTRVTTPHTFPHPGYAWAMSREAYDKIGGLFEYSIIGSGDHVMAMSFIGQPVAFSSFTYGYQAAVLAFMERCKGLRLGYVPGVIRHYFHGDKRNRQYMTRSQILTQHRYNPSVHVTKDSDGILIPSDSCPEVLTEAIRNYFRDRREDDEMIVASSSALRLRLLHLHAVKDLR